MFHCVEDVMIAVYLFEILDPYSTKFPLLLLLFVQVMTRPLEDELLDH